MAAGIVDCIECMNGSIRNKETGVLYPSIAVCPGAPNSPVFLYKFKDIDQALKFVADFQNIIENCIKDKQARRANNE